MRSWHFFKWRLLARSDGFPDFGVYRRLMRQQQMDAEQLAGLRREKTQRLVRECLRNIPYYGELMRAAGIEAEEVRGPEDLGVLPILDKETVRRESARMLNRAAPPSSYFPHNSGGSTGMPLDFYRGWEYTKIAGAAANMRSFATMGWKPGDMLVRFWAPREDETPPRGLLGQARRRMRRWLEPPEILFSSYQTTPRDMEGWLQTLIAVRPRFFYGYASNLILFADFLTERGVRVDCVEGIASTGDALFPRDRQRLQSCFPRATIIDIYGSREVPGIASECRHGTMHVNADLVHVDYEPTSEEPGRQRLIVTALDNLIFPFIRYDIGDFGAPQRDRCACGLAFPAMEWGFGKVLDSFLTPEGTLVTGGVFEDLMHHVSGVHAYQFRQKTVTDIRLYVVPSAEFGEETRHHLRRVETQIPAMFSPRARLGVEIVDAIPPTPAGKHQIVVSELRRGAPAALVNQETGVARLAAVRG